MQNWTPFMLVSSVYVSCCCVGPSPPEKYDNQWLGHLALEIITVYSFPHLSTSGQHIKTISQLRNRLTLANTAQDDHSLIKELLHSWSFVALRNNQFTTTRSTDQFLPSALHFPVTMQDSAYMCNVQCAVRH